MKKIILFIVLMFNFYYVSAYENDYFNINIPDDYKLVTSDNNIYKWEKDNEYILITISDNINKYNVKNYTDEDIQNQKIYIEDKINNSLTEYETKVSVTDINKTQINDMYSLNYTIYWPSKNDTGYDIYQFGNVISTDNYIYTIVYNTNNENIDEEFDSILKSFVPNDEVSIQNNQDFLRFIVIFIALVFFVIHFTKKYRKKIKKTKKKN